MIGSVGKRVELKLLFLQSQEVARWEENKKLQQQMEKLKERLAAKTKETDDKQKQINRLNEAVSR